MLFFPNGLNKLKTLVRGAQAEQLSCHLAQIQCFESVRSSIYSVYEQLECIEEPGLQNPLSLLIGLVLGLSAGPSMEPLWLKPGLQALLEDGTEVKLREPLCSQYRGRGGLLQHGTYYQRPYQVIRSP